VIGGVRRTEHVEELTTAVAETGTAIALDVAALDSTPAAVEPIVVELGP
jgi:hypothetical protein